MRWNIRETEDFTQFDIALEFAEPLYLSAAGVRYLPAGARRRLLFCKGFAYLFGFGSLTRFRVQGSSFNTTLWGTPVSPPRLSFKIRRAEASFYLLRPRRPAYVSQNHVLFWSERMGTRAFIQSSRLDTQNVNAYMGAGLVGLVLQPHAEIRSISSTVFVHLSRLVYCDATLLQILPSPERAGDTLLKFSGAGDLVTASDP